MLIDVLVIGYAFNCVHRSHRGRSGRRVASVTRSHPPFRHHGSVAGYDALAGEYYEDSHRTSRNFDAATRAAVAELGWTAPDGLILDAGCGRGRAIEYLAADQSRIVQLDSSNQMLALHPREPSLLRVLHQAESLPFADAQFGCVAAFLCDPFLGMNFLAESRRVLRPGGILFATTPAAEWGLALRTTLGLDLMTTRFRVASGQEVRTPSYLYAEEQILRMAARAQFLEERAEVNAHCVPASTKPISPDVTIAADALHVTPYELPVILSIRLVR